MAFPITMGMEGGGEGECVFPERSGPLGQSRQSPIFSNIWELWR